MTLPRPAATTPRVARPRLRAGLALLGASGLAAATLAVPAFAQDPPPEEPPAAGPAATVTKRAVYQYPYSETLPRTLTSEVPPGAVCVVRPDACPEQIAPVGTGIAGGIATVQESEPAPPQALVADGQVAVAILGGTPSYDAGIFVERPAVAPGEEFTTFSLQLPEVPGATYHSNSPAFRQAVLAALASIGGPNQEEFAKTFEEDPVDSTVINVEACPFLAPMEDGVGQSRDDLPASDCLFGTTGVRDDATGLWTFDLSIAAGAWSRGEIPYEGIYLRMAKAQNVAYGDPDPSTQARVTWDLTTATLATASAPPPEPPPAFDPGGFDTTDTSGSAGGSGGFSSGGSSGGFSSGGSSGGFSSGGSSLGSSGGFSSSTTAAPAVAGEGFGGSGNDVNAPVEEQAIVAADPIGANSPGSAWYVWLLLPMFAAGTYLTSQSLLSETEAVAGLGRSGAMTRLIAFQAARRGEAPTDDGPRLVDLG